MLLLCACKTEDRPARIVDPDSASRAELRSVVVEALHGVDVTLADDALTKSSVLIIEPTVQRDARNNRIMGREVRAPVQFVLSKRGDRCVLEASESHRRWVLTATRCAAE